MNNPEYAKINDKLYKINTSYKVALKCNEIIMDENIGIYEKQLAVIYLLFGEEGLNDKYNHARLIDIAFKYISCEEEIETNKEQPDMNFKQDFNLIKASFMSDYGIDISKEDLSWYDFYTYLNGLTDNCVLNRIRELRTLDLSKIDDSKEKRKIVKAKQRFALKKQEIKPTTEQEKIADEFWKKMGY